jgi:hypothetical protein
MDHSNVDEDKCFLLSLLPSFRQFNDDQKYLARMEILKIMRHVKLQKKKNVDMYLLLQMQTVSFQPHHILQLFN